MNCKESEDSINSPSELYDLIRIQSIGNLLLGNGFGLSHPTMSKAFIFDFNSVYKELSPYLKTKISFTCHEKKCPEKFLDKLRSEVPEHQQEELRMIATEAIVNSYINNFTENHCETEKLWNLYKKEPYSCNEFLGVFQHIYTLNYDPLMYFEFLKLWDNGRLHHQDGFIVKNGQAITQGEIVNNLKNSTYSFMYLHGNYFLNIDKKNQELNKLGRVTITRDYLHENIFNTNGSIRPFLILEGSSSSKKDLIDKHDYFKHCYQSLEETNQNTLVFGVSFKNDVHILQALQNEEQGKVFITYFDDDEKIEIKGKIPPNKQCKFHWIKLNTKNSIWVHDEIDDAINHHFDSLQRNSNNNPARWMADYEGAMGTDLPELIGCIEDAQSIEGFINCEDNNLYYELIDNPVLKTDIADGIIFENLKDFLLISLKCLEYKNNSKFAN